MKILHLLLATIPFFMTAFRTENDRNTSLDRYSNLNGSPPVVSIVSPLNRATYQAGSIVTVQVNAEDPDGRVVKVELYNRGIKFSEDSIAPYDYTDSAIQEGNYVLHARAFDNDGNAVTSDTVLITVSGCSSSGSITAEGFAIIEGSRVTDLLQHPFFPSDPIIVTEINKLEYGPGLGENYGVRLRGYICAPMSGNYVFHLASDDRSELWLSMDDNPATKRRIAYVDPWVGFRAWNIYPAQQSSPIWLVKGARYYIETLHKQYISFNHLSVAWTMPDGVFEAAIPGKRLSPYKLRPSEVPGQARVGGPLTFTGLTATSQRFHVTPVRNPARDQFSLIITSDTSERVTIIVTNSMGKRVEMKAGISSNGTIHFGHTYQRGIYFVEVLQGSERQSLKLIKQ